MLTEEQLRDTIEKRLDIMMNNPIWKNHVDYHDGVFRGLIWALTGEDPGTYLLKDTAKLCQLSGIPYKVEGGTVYYGKKHPKVLGE